MEITIQQPTLAKALELVTRVSTKHVTLPVLQCALIEVTDKTATITATNLEINIEVVLDAKIQETGTLAVPAATLLQSIQHLPHEAITLKQEDTVLVIESKSTQTSINSISHEEFPSITKLTEPGATINRALFSLGIKTASFAASQSSIKPELGSIFITQKKEHALTFVATDSFRLMEKTVPQKGLILNDSLLIPQKNATEIARICDLLESDPTFITNENQCALQFPDGVYVTTRLVTGSFPDYEQIMPKEFCTTTTVLRNDLLQAFKKTNVFLNKFMQTTLSVTKNSCTVSSSNNDIGHTTDSIKAQTDGEDITLNFNQRYLMDPLQHIQDDSVVMSFAGIGRPLILKGVNDSTVRYLVMPMNK